MRNYKTDRTGRSFICISVDIDTYTTLAGIARTEERSIGWVVKRITHDYKGQVTNE